MLQISILVELFHHPVERSDVEQFELGSLFASKSHDQEHHAVFRDQVLGSGIAIFINEISQLIIERSKFLVTFEQADSSQYVAMLLLKQLGDLAGSGEHLPILGTHPLLEQLDLLGAVLRGDRLDAVDTASAARACRR